MIDIDEMINVIIRSHVHFKRRVANRIARNVNDNRFIVAIRDRDRVIGKNREECVAKIRRFVFVNGRVNGDFYCFNV